MKISIILPTKNNHRTITKCIESIKNQDYKNVEVIFVDNFSTDDTFEIAKSYEDKMNLKAFQKWPERNLQRWFGFEQTTWEIVYFIDSDMYLSDWFLSEVASKFEEDKELGWIIVPEINVEWKCYWTNVKAFERWFYDGDDTIEAARIFRREVYEKAGWYDEKMISWEDWDLSARIRKIAKIDRIKSFVSHDEWEVDIKRLLKKKFYYWEMFDSFVESDHKNNVFSKIYIFRLAFYKKWKRYFQKPLLVPGLILMLSAELFVGWFGLVYYKIVKKFKK